jgi:NIPSNAP
MIVEERDYRVKHGQLAEFIEAYSKHGLPIQQELLGNFLGYFTTDIGELNHVVAWWQYDSLADREARRARMAADPRWKEYLKMTAGMLDIQQTRILVPTAFSPLR